MGSIRISPQDIFFYRACEQQVLLKNYCNVLTKVFKLVISYIMTTDDDFSARYII